MTRRRISTRFFLITALAAVLSAPGPRVHAAPPELVYYDFLEKNPEGNYVLRGGIYRDPALGELFRAQTAPPPGGPYRMRLVADAGAMNRAAEFTDLFLGHEAFAGIKDGLLLERVEGDLGRMNCRNDVPESPRIIRCDAEYILSLGTGPAHVTAVFTSRGVGGAGGAMPIASINYPAITMLHELLHTWTLNDEYQYSQSEADFYCSEPSILKGPNNTSLQARDSYESEEEAVRLHGGDIPWLADALLPITAPGFAGARKLGTQLSLGDREKPGLFSGANCSRKTPSFRPYGPDTIMRTLSADWIPAIHRKAVLAEIAKAAGWPRAFSPRQSAGPASVK